MNILQQRLNINRYLFRLIIVALLIAFVATQFAWAGRLFARVWNFPELRHRVEAPPSTVTGLNFAQLSVTNRGFGVAEDVLIHVNTRGSRIQWYQIDAQELYEIKTLDLGQGVIDIWLDRLTSGAQVQINIEGENLSRERVALSATSNQGISAPYEVETFSDQAKSYSGSAEGLFSKAWQIAINTDAVLNVLKGIPPDAPLVHFLNVIGSPEFQIVGLAILIPVLFVGIFFGYVHFLLVVFAGAWLLTWMFFDQISFSWLIGSIGLGVISWAWRRYYIRLTEELQLLGDIFVVMCFLLLFFALGCAVWWWWFVWLPVDLLTSVLAGLSIVSIVYAIRFLR
jgi:hypothetical protein